MKKKSIITLFIQLLLLITVMPACSDDDDDDKDITAPVITVLKPAASDQYLRGGVIIINADLADDVALKEMELSLMAIKALKGIDTPWSPEIQRVPLSGKTQQIRNVMVFTEIPSDIMSGSYILMIKVTDEAGNHVNKNVPITIE